MQGSTLQGAAKAINGQHYIANTTGGGVMPDKPHWHIVIRIGKKSIGYAVINQKREWVATYMYSVPGKSIQSKPAGVYPLLDGAIYAVLQRYKDDNRAAAAAAPPPLKPPTSCVRPNEVCDSAAPPPRPSKQSAPPLSADDYAKHIEGLPFY